MITTTEDLEELISRALVNDYVALDTEFLWERTYFPQLALIQLALSNDECFLIDPTVIEDLSSLGILLEDETTMKILHDAPQDLAILQRATGSIPENVFDTKLAAGFCGLSSSLSLGSLIEKLLDISLSKSETRTNWLQRPLSDDQIKYALDDVRYLRAARVVLQSRIYSPEVQSFLEEELLDFHNSLAYQRLADEERYTKVKGAKGLSRKSLAVLKELAAWREKRARKDDKPRGHILPDLVLTKISKDLLSEDSQIIEQSGISKKAGKKYLTEIKNCIAKGLKCPREKRPNSLKTCRLSEKNKHDLQKLAKMIRLKSDIKGIDPNILGNSSDLKYFIKNLTNPEKLASSKLYTGWRKKFISEFLL